MDNIYQIIYILPALLISITFHELAHGYTAYKLGDPTAKDMGRLTLNPLKHIDPAGFLMLVLFKFGWAKPVPFNPNYFKNRRQGTLLVSLAGPIANVIIAIIAIIAVFIFKDFGLNFFSMLIQFNIFFAIFNLLPLPPLDGSKILASLLPEKIEAYFYEYEKYGYVVLLILAFTGWISKIVIPLYSIVIDSLINFVQIFF
ncbi:MAG: site-2 protease family protein [Eubacteriaceae bacterium]|nr:site-2 protease family protein [Eubacteriaceae bacterium]